jgi:hypothetical protein
LLGAAGGWTGVVMLTVLKVDVFSWRRCSGTGRAFQMSEPPPCVMTPLDARWARAAMDRFSWSGVSDVSDEWAGDEFGGVAAGGVGMRDGGLTEVCLSFQCEINFDER